jgi:hypothetical protein
MTRPFGSDRPAVAHFHRLSNVAVQPEAMHFQIRPVRRRREQMHRQVVCAVRGKRQVVRLGQVRHLHEYCDAAAIGHVRLGKGHAAGRDHLGELVQRVQVLAGGNRHPAVAHDARVARDVVGDGWLLQPDQVLVLQGARGTDRLVHCPAHVGIGHQREVGAQIRAHRPHAFHVFRQARTADLHLDRAEALGEVVVGLPQQCIQRKLEVDAASVARHRRVEPGEQAP